MNKPLILGVVTVLAMAGGRAHATSTAPTFPNSVLRAAFTAQANAATCPETPEPLFDFTLLLTPPFTGSCTLGGTVFDAFTFHNVQAFNNVISFGSSGLVDTVTLAQPVPPMGLFNEVRFGFTVAAAGTNRIVEGTIGNVASAGSSLTLTARMSGAGFSNLVSVGPNNTHTVFGPPLSASSVTVTEQQASITSGRLESITDTFTQSVPEPMSLSLFGLGLAGLALARRRCS